MIPGLENKVVAVVGIGNSGGDVAVELSKMAKQVIHTSCSIIYLFLFSYFQLNSLE